MAETKSLSLPVILPPGYEACERCVNRLLDSLRQVDGVLSAEVDRQTCTLKLLYDPRLATIEDVERKAKHIGVGLKEHFEHRTLTLMGLDCPDCALKLEKGVGRMDGVLWASTNYASGKMSVEYEPDKTDVSSISERIRKLGYDVEGAEAGLVGEPLREREFTAVERRAISRQEATAVVSGIALGVGLVLSAAGQSNAARAAYAFAAVVAGYYATRGAVYSVRSFSLDMNFLMTVAAIGAMAIGEWFDAAAVMFLFSLGNALESRTVERTRDSIRSLIGLFPAQALVRTDGTERWVDIREVRVGDVLIVRPGDKIPMDGEVIAGSSTVNQAPITGESIPVEKVVSDRVFAGSINQAGSLTIRATATADDNSLARIIHMVEKAQAEKAPTQRFSELFGKYYTPAVVGLAVLIAAVPTLVFDAPFRPWLYRALTLLVVSCPCALVISTPVAIVSAIGNAARNGILIKGGSYLEIAGDMRVIAFDKTGTLTTGEARVTDIVPADGYSKQEILSLAASVESRSEHPLGQAILREARKADLKPREITDFESLTGMGAAAKFNGSTCVIGNTRLMEQLGIELGRHDQMLRQLQDQGKTVVMVAADRKLAGIIALSDTVRQTAQHAFEDLRHIGISRIVMITGDNEKTARSVARSLGVDEYYAELLPEDKVDIVRLLIERYHRVTVVGDGVNDAPALAAASLGIAMGAAGSDTALETADIALMSDDLGRLPYAMQLSRRALTTVKQNMAFSLLVIAVLIATTLAGWLRLSEGVFGHEGSALIVIANGMRLLGFRPGHEHVHQVPGRYGYR